MNKRCMLKKLDPSDKLSINRQQLYKVIQFKTINKDIFNFTEILTKV
jgi:hypothetical protein